MTMNDDWLLEAAARVKARRGQPKAAKANRMAGQPIGELWSQLQRETTRQAKVYTDAVGDAGAVKVETPADEIRVTVRDGKAAIVRLDRKTGLLSESYRNEGGGRRMRRPLFSFRVDAAGELGLNCDLREAAASLLRRLID